MSSEQLRANSECVWEIRENAGKAAGSLSGDSHLRHRVIHRGPQEATGHSTEQKVQKLSFCWSYRISQHNTDTEWQ